MASNRDFNIREAKFHEIDVLEYELLTAIEEKVPDQKEIQRCITEISKKEKEAKSTSFFSATLSFFSAEKTPSLNVQYSLRKKRTPLHLLAERGDIGSIKQLLEHSPNLDIKDSSLFQHTAISLAADAKQWEIVKALAEAKANLNIPLAWGEINLVLSTTIDLHAPYSVIQVLLKNGADPNQKNANGNSALEQLVSYQIYSKRINVAALLLEYKAEMTETTKKLLSESLTEKYNDPKATQFCRQKLNLSDSKLTPTVPKLKQHHFLAKKVDDVPTTPSQGNSSPSSDVTSSSFHK